MKLFVFLVITFSASLLKDLPPHGYFVVWNVGQGQWTTAVGFETCRHFDAGGEFFPWRKILRVCGEKKNVFFFSHWDWDHIGALARKTLQALDSCRAVSPLGKAPSRQKEKLLNSLPSCSAELWGKVFVWKSSSAKNANERSTVFTYTGVLLPGDSPASQERIWNNAIAPLRPRLLVLGHHGSKTSTSPALLESLPSVHTAVSSARWARYHHPHPAVEARLKRARIALLRTEDWGHIWFETALTDE